MSDAIRELEIELHGFYIGAVTTLGDSPEKPDDVRPRPIVRFHTGEVVGHIELSTRDTGILDRQLRQGVEAPRRAAELAAALIACRDAQP